MRGTGDRDQEEQGGRRKEEGGGRRKEEGGRSKLPYTVYMIHRDTYACGIWEGQGIGVCVGAPAKRGNRASASAWAGSRVGSSLHERTLTPPPWRAFSYAEKIHGRVCCRDVPSPPRLVGHKYK